MKFNDPARAVARGSAYFCMWLGYTLAVLFDASWTMVLVYGITLLVMWIILTYTDKERR